ncbi:MAG: hypothetical protein QM572_14675 [Nocardioides sp.]|uniref:hypothetical protein n=1 Tax=Nocardioides sp. TaxID=35761 RepID=UPI0039E64981
MGGKTDFLGIIGRFVVTSPLRSVCYAARHAPDVREAVAWIDRATAADLVSREEMREFAAGLDGMRGAGQCRRAIDWASENCWTPTESAMRMILTLDLGIGGVVSNQPVFDGRGRHLGTPDLLDPVAGIAWEYDGEVHWRQRAADLRRDSRFRAAGIETVSMVGADLGDPTDFVQRTELAYEAAARRPAGSAAWTVRAPQRWASTTTVERRRALDDRNRDRLLGWQVA